MIFLDLHKAYDAFDRSRCLQEGKLAEEATWKAMVLIPKGKKGYQVIGLVEVLWKVVAAI